MLNRNKPSPSPYDKLTNAEVFSIIDGFKHVPDNPSLSGNLVHVSDYGKLVQQYLNGKLDRAFSGLYDDIMINNKQHEAISNAKAVIEEIQDVYDNSLRAVNGAADIAKADLPPAFNERYNTYMANARKLGGNGAEALNQNLSQIFTLCYKALDTMDRIRNPRQVNGENADLMKEQSEAILSQMKMVVESDALRALNASASAIKIMELREKFAHNVINREGRLNAVIERKNLIQREVNEDVAELMQDLNENVAKKYAGNAAMLDEIGTMNQDFEK